MSVRHFTARILMCITLGAATTVAIAWAIALRGVERGRWVNTTPSAMLVPGTDRGAHFQPDRGLGWTTLPTSSYAAMASECSDGFVVASGGGESAEIVCARAYALPERRHPPADEMIDRTEFRFGLPMRCLWGAHDTLSDCSPNDMGTECVVMLQGAKPNYFRATPFLRVSDAFGWESAPRALPFGILPLGFAADTALFAGAWLVVLIGFAGARRAIRRRRGQCPRCAYALAGLSSDSPCPECGHAHSVGSTNEKP